MLLKILCCSVLTALPAVAGEPLRVLIATSGCCHNYDFQTKAIQLAAKEAGVDVVWTVANDGGKGTKGRLEVFEKPDWADSFDLVIHNECFADTTDADYIRSITEAHREGLPAVVVHCAMHTFRSVDFDDWRQMLGVTSRRHEHKSRYPVTVAATDHPIMRDFPDDWVTPNDELYIIEKTWPGVTVLATSQSEKADRRDPVFWTHQFGDGRVFGTTYGHSDETFSDPVYTGTLVRGMLWAAGRLE